MWEIFLMIVTVKLFAVRYRCIIRNVLGGLPFRIKKGILPWEDRAEAQRRRRNSAGH
jgi:hypothetical protein